MSEGRKFVGEVLKSRAKYNGLHILICTRNTDMYELRLWVDKPKKRPVKFPHLLETETCFKAASEKQLREICSPLLFTWVPRFEGDHKSVIGSYQ